MDPSLINFIKEFLANTLRLDFHYFTYPYSDISNFDRSLRTSLTNSDKLYTQIDRFFHSMENDIFYFITDNYMINYIAFFPFKDKSDVISIGPYFTQHLNDEYWNKITETNHLTSSDIQSIKGFLFSIPRIENNLYLHSIVSNIVSYANNKESSSFAVKYHDFSVTDNDYFIYTPKDDFEVYSDAISNRYHIENELLEKIGNGNWEEALAEAEKFMSTPIEPRLNNSLRDQKSMLTSTNTLFRKSVEGQKIHPVYLHEISSKFVNLIENTTSDRELDKIYEQMIYEYCLLVQNKSRDMYSLPIRKIVDYIDLNLNYPLTLKQIADKFNLSAPYISSLFKKEVGTTLIKYINQLRIDNSLKLLQSSTMSIQDIAAYVGFYDNNYFTKLFKREMGMTPTEYRKGTNGN